MDARITPLLMDTEDIQELLRLEALRSQEYKPEYGDCPYCKAAGRPTGIACEHWRGLGWQRDAGTVG